MDFWEYSTIHLSPPPACSPAHTSSATSPFRSDFGRKGCLGSARLPLPAWVHLECTLTHLPATAALPLHLLHSPGLGSCCLPACSPWVQDHLPGFHLPAVGGCCLLCLACCLHLPLHTGTTCSCLPATCTAPGCLPAILPPHTSHQCISLPVHLPATTCHHL